MKNLILSFCLGMSLAAAPVGAQWYEIDDFEQGNLEGWELYNNPTEGTHIFALTADPADAGNTVVRVAATSEGERIVPQRLLPAWISEGETGTLYQRVRSEGAARNINFGISEIWSQGTVDFWGDFEVLLFMHNQSFGGRNGLDLLSFNAGYSENTWYEIWAVMRNNVGEDNDTYDVYVRGGTQFAEQTLVAENVSFRNGTEGILTKYAIIALNGTQWGGDAGALGSDAMLFDNIYFAEGQLLSTPNAQNISNNPPDIDENDDPDDDPNDNGGGDDRWQLNQKLGWMYDYGSQWSYSLFLGGVYSGLLDQGYIYHQKVGWVVMGEGTSANGIWLYSMDPGYGWIYTTDTLGGWFQAEGLGWGWENFTQ